jgi:serine/threonine-protein kinase HipA
LANDAGGDEVFAAMIAMVEQVPRAVSVVEGELPSDFPEVIWERITTGMQRQGERFLAMVAGESA